MMRRGLAALGATLILTGGTAGCTDDGASSTNAEPSGTPTSEAPTSPPTTTPSPTSPAPSSEEAEVVGGTAAAPAPVEPSTRLLEWSPVPQPATSTVTRGGPWTLTVNESSTLATFEGKRWRARFVGSERQRVSDAMIRGDWGVVVFQDEQETRPAEAHVVRLGAQSGRFTVDGSSDVPTTTGGTWALGEGTLVHATIGPRASYCLATVDLGTRASERTWCAERRHGYNGAQITPAGTSLMTFDDQQPSCRTVAQVSGHDLDPFEGVEDCLGWEGVLTGDGAVWSVVPKQTRVEAAHYYARDGDEYFDLGPGTSGTLVWCAGSAYFAQDPLRDGDPARLLRWTADRALEVVYETQGRGPAFLTEPRCGGDQVTVTALGKSGDEQVTAEVG
ncbi:MAG TPA: hypothetical protein VFN12_16295 [Nocardioides sp.]|nr:hypothetical protein [Nocardioides sp.]